MRLKDSDPMPFGKHKGTRMEDVPAEYLLWLYNNKRNTLQKEVLEYIKHNLSVLEYEIENGK